MVRIAAPITAPRYTQNWVLNIQTPNLIFFSAILFQDFRSTLRYLPT